MNRQIMWFSLGLIWIATAFTVVLLPLGFTRLPANVMQSVMANSKLNYSQDCFIAYLITLGLSSFLICTQSKLTRPSILITLLLLCASSMVLGLHAIEVRMGNLIELNVFILGFLFVASIQDANKVTISRLRLHVLSAFILIGVFILSILGLGPQEFLKDYDVINYNIHLYDWLTSIAIVSILVSMIGLCFKSKLFKIIFSLSAIPLSLIDIFSINANFATANVIDNLLMFNIGMILGFIYSPFLKDMFNYEDFINWWLDVVKSCYSELTYKKIAFEKSGYGFLYLLLLIIPLTCTLAYRSYETSSIAKVQHILNENKNIPLLKVVNGNLELNAVSPYYINDASGNPIIIYDNTGKYKSMTDTNSSVLVLETPQTVYIDVFGKPYTFHLNSEYSDLPMTQSNLLAGFTLKTKAVCALEGIAYSAIYFSIIIFLSRFNRYLKNFDFKTRMRMTLYSRIPLVLIVTLLIFKINLVIIILMLLGAISFRRSCFKYLV